MTTNPTSARRNQFGIIITPMTFGAVGDGVADDSIPWAAFQAAKGPKFVPAGRYKLSSTDTRRFDKGAFGNGEFIDTHAAGGGYLTHIRGDQERDSLIVDSEFINRNEQEPSTAIKIQRRIHYDDVNPETVQTQTRILGAYFEGVGTGRHTADVDDSEGNFTVLMSTAHNKIAGFHGMTAVSGRVWHANEEEVPDIELIGAPKSAGAYFTFTERTRNENNGLMFGAEIFCINTAEETLDIPYPNSDVFDFQGWNCGLHIAGLGGGAPITTAVLIDGRSSTKHTFWNGLIIGGSAFRINEVPGYEGTVGINFGSWSTYSRGDVAIKYGVARRHHYYKDGCRIQTSLTTHINEDGDSTIRVQAKNGSVPRIELGVGASSAFNPAYDSLGYIDAAASRVAITSVSGEIQLAAENGAAIYKATSLRFAPATDNDRVLGGPTDRWSTVFAGTGTINTSDARLKQQIADLSAAEKRVGLACLRMFKRYKWNDSVAEKGSAARWHVGTIAQDVMAAFAAEGLDAHNYGVLCWDDWDAVPEIRTEHKIVTNEAVYAQVPIMPNNKELVETEPGVFIPVNSRPEYKDGELLVPAEVEELITVTPAIPAGDRYGIRYDELMVFCMAALAEALLPE